MRLRTQIEETGKNVVVRAYLRFRRPNARLAIPAGVSPLDVLPAALPGIKTYVDQCLKDRAAGISTVNLGVPR